jgi:hypothetical protein
MMVPKIVDCPDRYLVPRFQILAGRVTRNFFCISPFILGFMLDVIFADCHLINFLKT